MPNKEGGSHPTPRIMATRELAARLCFTSILYALEGMLVHAPLDPDCNIDLLVRRMEGYSPAIFTRCSRLQRCNC
jgi:hypothetical protein